jgi:hypothetical protein
VERRTAAAVGEAPTAISIPSATEQHPFRVDWGEGLSLHHFVASSGRCAVGEEFDTKENLRVRLELS